MRHSMGSEVHTIWLINTNEPYSYDFTSERSKVVLSEEDVVFASPLFDSDEAICGNFLTMSKVHQICVKAK